MRCVRVHFVCLKSAVLRNWPVQFARHVSKLCLMSKPHMMDSDMLHQNNSIDLQCDTWEKNPMVIFPNFSFTFAIVGMQRPKFERARLLFVCMTHHKMIPHPRTIWSSIEPVLLTEDKTENFHPLLEQTDSRIACLHAEKNKIKTLITGRLLKQ